MFLVVVKILMNQQHQPLVMVLKRKPKSQTIIDLANSLRDPKELLTVFQSVTNLMLVFTSIEKNHLTVT